LPLARTAPLRQQLEAALPDRPFTVRFWDGTSVPATSGNGDGPTFTVRSPKALGHALRAPGQLGLGRAYVSGELEVDDMDAVIEVLNTWKPPPVDRARLALAAARAAGIQVPPSPPQAELRPRGRRHTAARGGFRFVG